MTISLIISSLTIFLLLILSTTVLYYDYHSRVNRAFFLLCCSILFWMVANLLGDYFPIPTLTLFFFRISIIGPLFSPLFFSELVKELYYTKHAVFQRSQRRVTIISAIVCIIIISLSQAKLNIVAITPFAWGTGFEPGILYSIVLIYLAITFLFSFFYLWKVIKESEKAQKTQALLILIGAFVTLTSTVATNVIFPIFGNSYLASFGPIFILFFIIPIAIAITRHHLFNIKIITIELIIIILWIFLLLRTLLATNLHEVITEGSLLVISIILGILLIRSTIFEIDQKAKIAELTLELKNNYASQKDPFL